MTRATGRASEALLKTVVRQGESAGDRAERTLDELLQRSEQGRRALLHLLGDEFVRALDNVGLARRRDIERLAARVEALERKQEQSADPAPEE